MALLAVALPVVGGPFVFLAPVALVVLVMLPVAGSMRSMGPAVGVQVKLLEAGGDGRVERRQAPRALARDRRGRGPGREDAFRDRLELDLERHVRACGYANKLEAQVLGGRHGPRLSQRGPRLTAKQAHVEDKRAAGCICACIGHDSVLAYG